MKVSSAHGFSLIETIVSMGVLTVGMLGTVGVLARGMSHVAGSPGHVIAAQKAAEAIESVFSARDTRLLTWAQIRNVAGASGTDGGVFLDGATALKTAGPDGLVNTADDGSVEQVENPGPDGIIGTADDQIVVLNGFTREIEIRDVQPALRQIKVTIKYQQGSTERQYQLVTAGPAQSDWTYRSSRWEDRRRT